MARPRKAREEGAAAKPAAELAATNVEAALAEVPDLPVVNLHVRDEKHPDPVPGDDGDALQRISESFQARFPDDWDNIRLCPLQHGLEAMADILRNR